MKHNKNADSIFFVLLCSKSQREKNIQRTFVMSAGAQKGWETAGSGTTWPQYLPNPKIKFTVKFIFT